MFGRKISVHSDLYEQLKRCAEAGGYATAEEFATHVLEREVDRLQGGGREPVAETIPETSLEPESHEMGESGLPPAAEEIIPETPPAPESPEMSESGLPPAGEPEQHSEPHQ